MLLFTLFLTLTPYACGIPLAKRQGSSTANDVNDGKCAPVTLIFARGTSEGGNLGSIVGPPLASGLQQALGNVAIQGVDYPASVQGNADGGAQGGQVAAGLIQKAKSQCPSTKIVIGGYSQGAMVATKAGEAQPQDITAAVLYGNPFHPGGDKINGVSQDKIISFCASGDGVCETGTFAITQAHLSYGSNGDIQKGVDFVKSKVGTSGSSTSTNTTPTAAPAPAPAPAPATTSASSTSSLSGLSGLSALFGGSSGLSGLSGLTSRTSSSSSGLGSLSGFSLPDSGADEDDFVPSPTYLQRMTLKEGAARGLSPAQLLKDFYPDM